MIRNGAQPSIPYAREFVPRDQGLAEFKKEGDFMKCHFVEQSPQPYSSSFCR